jgi:hypothetical protein
MTSITINAVCTANICVAAMVVYFYVYSKLEAKPSKSQFYYDVAKYGALSWIIALGSLTWFASLIYTVSRFFS